MTPLPRLPQLPEGTDAAFPKTENPLGRQLSRDAAYNQIFTAIQSGQLAPGDVLRDDELMAWLRMSREPIRQALLRLAEAGLVEVAAGKKTIVASANPRRVNHALIVSNLYNRYAVSRVAGALTPGQLTALTDASTALTTAATIGSRDGAARAISAFFDVITEAVGNDVFNTQTRRIDAELGRFLSPDESDIDIPTAARGIAALNDALQAGNRDAAYGACIRLSIPAANKFLHRYREPEPL